MIPTIAPYQPAPRMHWWGNVFYRKWLGWKQLVIVIRLPWWRETYLPQTDDMGRGQLCISWRAREGWRKGWRPA